MITSVDARSLKLTAYDDRIYSEFRLIFPDFDISYVNESDLKSSDAKKVCICVT